ncbi:MAG: VWA domain-containing protein [Vicinamibacterales bacterium]|nr:VWA domain-containing protein [Vicinamibacterales bacterium]
MWPDAFAAPWVLLALGVPVALLVVRLRQRATRPTVPVHASALFAPLPRTWRERARWLPDAMRLAAIACAVVALAGPLAWRTEEQAQAGADVMLLIDVSSSMQALDFTPDRLGAAKAFAERVLDRRPADRIGLMTFASRSALRAPLTRDHEAVRAAIRDLVPGEERLGEGTALGAAVVSAVERLARGRAGDRLLVLLSDGHGVREEVPPADAAALAAARQVRVVTVGIGSGGAVPYPTEFGRVDVVLPLDAATLGAIADRTRGRYFAAPDELALRAVSDAIEELESPAPVAVSRPELFSVAPAWILAALALGVAEAWLAATLLRRHPE